MPFILGSKGKVMNDMAKSVTASVAIHLSIFALQLAMFGGFMNGGGQDGAGNQAKQSEGGKGGSTEQDKFKADIILPPIQARVVEEKDIPQPKTEVASKLPARKKIQPADDRCETYYGGIGVRTERNVVTVVFAGYPAEQAGILVGDTVVSPPSTQIRGEIDEPITVRVLRNGELIDFELFRTKICYENTQK